MAMMKFRHLISGLALAGVFMIAGPCAQADPTPVPPSADKATTRLSPTEGVDLTQTLESGAAQCAAYVARARGLLETAEAFEEVDKQYLGPLGVAITSTKINAALDKGKTVEAVQTGATYALDTVMCAAATAPAPPPQARAVCMSWVAGRSIGELINAGPKLLGISDQTVNDWWTEKLANWIYRPPSEAEINRMIAEAQKRQHKLRQQAERARTQASAPMCKNAGPDLKPVLRYTPYAPSQVPPPTAPPPTPPALRAPGSTAPIQDACRLFGSC